MRVNPLRWLWGLVPVAMLCFIALMSERPRIETDLKTRSLAALNAAGFGWAQPSFTGRDGTLAGMATDEGEPNDAARRVLATWGVRVLDNRSELAEKADVFRWSAIDRDNRIRISGFVPNEAARKSVMTSAKAAFPKREVEDTMKLARGAPPRDQWLAGVGFGLKSLTHLKNGTVELEGTSMSIAGPANDAAGYRTVRGAIQKDLPKGITMKSDRVTPPVANPYVWSARREGTQLQLGGHVSSEQQRQQIAAAVRESLPRATLADRSELAIGAPEGFMVAVIATIRALGRLEEGSADLRASQLNIAGLATDDVVADTVRRALREAMPASIRLTEAIRFKAPALPTFDPFRTTVDAGGPVVVLSGHAPSEAAKAALAETARARLPNRRIDNQLVVGNGAAAGWQSCTQAALSGLGRLGGGKATLTGRRLELTGETTEEALHGAIGREVAQAAGGSCDVDADVALRDVPEPNLTWRAAGNGRQVEIDGEVPDLATKRALGQLAGQQFPGQAILDRSRVAGVTARRWGEVAEIGLRQLARLRSGKAELTGQQLTVSGEAPDRAVVGAVQETLSSRLARGFTGRASLSVRTDAEIAAEETRRRAEAEAKRRNDEQAALEARRRTEEADAKRRADEAEARRREDEARRREEDARRSAADQAQALARQRLDIERCQADLRRVARAGQIQFERASADINARSHGTLDELARVVRACPAAVVEIEGHTDAEGAPDRNQRLSERRAGSVREYLIQAGADPQRLIAVGYGQEKPIAPNDTAESRARNRRIEFTVKSN
jgi:outer membrane protein OmpA-like peptidoglycan-associated protein